MGVDVVENMTNPREELMQENVGIEIELSKASGQQ